MAKVVVTARLPGRVAELLAGHEVVAPAGDAAELTPEELDAALGDAVALLPLLKVRVDEALLGRAPRLRIVANYAVGVDNVDLAAATRRGVVVTHTPGVLTEATADLTLALLLACARRLPEADRLARSGRWRGWEPDQLTGLDLDGALLGIVGLGRIGQAVARRARGFGMRVMYAAPRPVAAEVERELAARQVALDELFASADAVSLHCPLTDETRHLVDARALARMKRTALVVNTARGPIVDERALADALEAGRIAGCGLDVFEAEPRIDARLVASPRAVLAPHIGSATRGARTRMAEMAAASIADLLAGRRPVHVVNPDAIDTTRGGC
jgi:glyoxylate reductase